MAEVVALAASIIAIIQAAERIEQVCRFFIESVNGYPSDLRIILIEASSLKTTFQNLEFIENHDAEASTFLEKLKAPGGPIAGCLESISELEKLVPSATIPDPFNPAKRRKTAASLTSLAWPLKRDKAKKLLNDIAQYKSTISTSLSVELLYVLAV